MQLEPYARFVLQDREYCRTRPFIPAVFSGYLKSCLAVGFSLTGVLDVERQSYRQLLYQFLSVIRCKRCYAVPLPNCKYVIKPLTVFNVPKFFSLSTQGGTLLSSASFRLGSMKIPLGFSICSARPFESLNKASRKLTLPV